VTFNISVSATRRSAPWNGLGFGASGDIPDPDMRATYLREVPANVRLLGLARKWEIDTSALDVGN
jgi:hypothetical protein